MLSSRALKLGLLLDGVFSVILTMNYFILRRALPEINTLFFVSYLFLILGAIMFYLLRANKKKALWAHMAIFPIFSIAHTFFRLIPVMTGGLGALSDVATQTLLEGTIVYLIAPLGFIVAHFHLNMYELTGKRILPSRGFYPIEENAFVNFVLFAVTLLTVFIAGNLVFRNPLSAGLFSGSVLLSLGMHEFGHEIVAYRHKVATTLPYLIPAPTVLGTFGAFTRAKSPIRTRGALIEIGAVGPITGFLVASTFVLLGSMFVRSSSADLSVSVAPVAFIAPRFFLTGQVPASIRLNPLTFAGWAMMLLTALNLMPAGELDGGHVARGFLSRKKHGVLGKVMGIALILSGLIFLEMLFLVWGVFVLIASGTSHPGALDNKSKDKLGIPGRDKFLAIVAIIVLVLSLPVPL